MQESGAWFRENVAKLIGQHVGEAVRDALAAAPGRAARDDEDDHAAHGRRGRDPYAEHDPDEDEKQLLGGADTRQGRGKATPSPKTAGARTGCWRASPRWRRGGCARGCRAPCWAARWRWAPQRDWPTTPGAAGRRAAGHSRHRPARRLAAK